MDRIYILQTHEEHGVYKDNVEVYTTLREAADAFNVTVKDIATTYGDKEYKTSCMLNGDIKDGEGQPINREYEVTVGGMTQTVSLYSQEIDNNNKIEMVYEVPIYAVGRHGRSGTWSLFGYYDSEKKVRNAVATSQRHWKDCFGDSSGMKFAAFVFDPLHGSWDII